VPPRDEPVARAACGSPAHLESACAGLPSKTTHEATSRRALGPVESSGGELGPDKIALETPNIDTRAEARVLLMRLSRHKTRPSGRRWCGNAHQGGKNIDGHSALEWQLGILMVVRKTTRRIIPPARHCRSIVEVVGGGQPASSAAALPSGERSPSQWRV
jgi:hypothetical protein